MAESLTLSFRCPGDILAAIDKALESSDRKQTEVITTALRVGLGLTSPASDVRARVVGWRDEAGKDVWALEVTDPPAETTDALRRLVVNRGGSVGLRVG